MFFILFIVYLSMILVDLVIILAKYYLDLLLNLERTVILSDPFKRLMSDEYCHFSIIFQLPSMYLFKYKPRLKIMNFREKNIDNLFIIDQTKV